MSSWDEYIGYAGTGSFNQTGGTHETEALYVGYRSGSNGTYIQTGGTSAISHVWDGKLYLGYDSGSSGAYELSGSGQLSADHEYIGFSGTGTFTQTAGSNSITDKLYLGYNSGGHGTYYLRGTYGLSETAQLSAEDEYIGRLGTGAFTHTGGSNTITYGL